jgi:hypothetical protein
MNNVLIEKEALVTQSVKSVVELLNYIGQSADPLPDSVKLPGLVLVLSSRKDVYYTTTARSCSCPSANYRPDQTCKHRQTYFPDVEKAERIAEAKSKTELSRQQARDYQAQQRALKAKALLGSAEDERLTANPEDRIKPEGKWPGGHNGPVEVI